MVRNPLRTGRRKPYALPQRPRPLTVEVAGRARFGWFRGAGEQSRDLVKAKPHLFLVSSLFIFLFATDRINLITFISLGFFCILFSDHMVDTGRDAWQRRKDRKNAGANALFQGPARHPQLGYFQRLAKKQSQRPPHGQ